MNYYAFDYIEWNDVGKYDIPARVGARATSIERALRRLEEYGNSLPDGAVGYSPGWDRPHAFILTPLPCRVVVVDNVADLEALMTLYADRASPMWEAGIFTLSPIDFPALARDFDAMHLTDAGQWATRFSMPFSLYGWDCESTLWFRWMFSDEVTHVQTASLIP